MFSVSQTTSHAIRALACLATPRCARPSVATVSACSGVPKPYLAKVIRHLCTAGIVEARRGRAGGVRLARPPETVRLWDICAAIDGEDCLSGCLLGEALCSGDRGCPTHDFWAAHRAAIRRKLEETTLAEAIRHAGRDEATRAGLTRAKFFDDARGSATECAACLDALVAKRACPEARNEQGKALMVRVVSMLSRLVDLYSPPPQVLEAPTRYGIEDEDETSRQGDSGKE